ncbi:MAG TPA: ion channel [Methylococcus sp.]|nr:ion channel [Methylococcus sp.]
MFDLRSLSGRFRGFGQGPHYYVYLLVTLFGLLVVSAVTGWFVIGVVEQLITIGVLVTGTLATGRTRAQIVVTVGAAAVMVVSGWTRLFWHDLYWFTVAGPAAGLLFFSRVTLALARAIFSSRERISASLLYGAVSIYLLMGFSFANAHLLLETLVPGSYQCNSPQCRLEPKAPVYLYFSLITLATVGYGDIVPSSRIAGMLAYLEAITGQMYVAILVARLVGMQINQSRRE